jgi:Zn-dependent peptidase ImmA (M78 family)
MQRLARRFKVSTLVIVRRLYDLGTLDEETLWRVYREELERVKALTTREGGGRDFYNSLGGRVSKRFASAAVGSTLEGQTSFTDSLRMLEIKKSATFYEEARRLGLHG